MTLAAWPAHAPAEWICVGPWAIPADFRHARHVSLRWPAARRAAASWAREATGRCGCRIAPEDAAAPPALKGDWVSLRHRFWFRRTPKCGQTSASQLLQRCERALDLHPASVLGSAGSAPGASTAGFRYVALVRDPVDRFCSGYHELWARLSSLNLSRSELQRCLASAARRDGRCANVDVEDPALHALAESAFFEWPTDLYAERTLIAVLEEVDRAVWPGACTSEVRAHARSLNHLFPQAWSIGRAAAKEILGREVYVGSRLGAWPEVVLRAESLQEDFASFFASLNVSEAECPSSALPRLNQLATGPPAEGGSAGAPSGDSGRGGALAVSRKRLRRQLLKGRVRRRFCRAYAVDFLYLGYEESWQQHCAQAVGHSLTAVVRGRLRYLAGRPSSAAAHKAVGTGPAADAAPRWRLQWRLPDA